MKDIIISGGWIMLPIILCSVIALAIILERFWSLRRGKVFPCKVLDDLNSYIHAGKLDDKRIELVRKSSPAGEIMAAAMDNRHRRREIMKEAVQDTGRHVVHDMERFLNTLGTIAGIAPLLGLLGTVIGMINVFAAIINFGVGDPTKLAGGISQALITTAAGLTVAIPAYAFFRYFQGRVNAYVVDIERMAISLIEAMDRRQPPSSPGR